MTRAIPAIALLLCAGSLFAQTPAPAATAQTPTAAPAPKPAPPSADAEKIKHMEDQLNDWPNLARYRAENAGLPQPAANEQRVVFYGDSITDGWGRWPGLPPFFPGKPYVNRGISGQTTPQMLVRFQQDVVALHPAAVLILAGTNDVAGNTGPSTPQMTEDNFAAIAAIAKANHIKVILASILPAFSYPWKPGVEPVAPIREINKWLKDYAAANDCIYLDYYSAMVDEKGGMKPGLAKDGVHPTAEGYGIMAPLAEAAIAQALAK